LHFACKLKLNTFANFEGPSKIAYRNFFFGRQPCPAALPGSLAQKQLKPVHISSFDLFRPDLKVEFYTMQSSQLAWQPCVRLPGSLARACPAALRVLLSRQV
jgi:hypothetical protein